ncbi:hypothetical protein G3479_06240 [Shewanella baltica]|uniref:hypothetical protein n=1 Tax=Shewanella baltica TaxID=62322 RepID=UPI00217DE001|nr:hypothetical protein [Shewanella baltica]MCS6258865.1 hypothetical protein [Shewanella baltica]
MNWKDIANTVGGIAGAVAPLLGGPVGLAVSIGSQIAGALGTDNTPEAVAAALQRDPNAALKLQEWAMQEREQIRQGHLELQRLALDEYKADLSDRQNARQAHKDHWMPSALTITLVSMLAALIAALFYLPIPSENRDLIVYLAGNLLPMVTGSVYYWVSSTKDANNREKLMTLASQGQQPAPAAMPQKAGA